MAEYLYMNIAKQIEFQIESGILKEGQKLPSEREMSENFGISRNIVREALKILVEKGLIHILPGKGVYISSPNNSETVDKLEIAIRRSHLSLMEILEARKVIELGVIPIAVKNATKEDVSDLWKIYNRMEICRASDTNFAEEDRKFHMQIAKCTKNEVLSILVETFYNIIDKKLFLVSQFHPKRVISGQHEHKAMITAIENRDEKAAINAMTDHIECIHDQLMELDKKQSMKKANV